MDKEALEKVESFREALLHFYGTLHPYDLYALYWLGGVAFLLFVLTILLRKNQIASGLTLILFLSSIFLAPFVIYIKMHEYLYGTDYKITYLKQMKFANVMVVRGEVKNRGDENITECRFHTFVMPPQDGFMKDLQFLYAVKPIQRRVFTIDERIDVGESKEFKLKFRNFKYNEDINSSDIYIYRECYNENIHLD